MKEIFFILLISFLAMMGLTLVDGQGFAWFATGFSALSTLLLVLQLALVFMKFYEQWEREFPPLLAQYKQYGFVSPEEGVEREQGRHKRGKYKKKGNVAPEEPEMQVKQGGLYVADSI